MIGHILSTGDEILLGDIQDTNSRFLSRNLKELGVDVHQIISVPDSSEKIADTIKKISKEADICMVTGGLGPTKDDVTAQACAMASGIDIELNDQALETMKAYFEKRGFIWTLENRKQAMLPSGAKVLVNNYGTAPGFYLKIQKCIFFFMPGPPSEMHPMFMKQVKPVLDESFDLGGELLIERLRVFMLPESKLGVMLDGFEEQFADFKLGFRFSFPTIEVKIRYSGKAEINDDVHENMEKAKEWVLGRLGTKVVSITGASIVQEVARLLTEQHKTLAIAESCTGGLISNMVTNVAGSSDFFLFSGVTYSNDAKEKVLGVKLQTLIDNGAVHELTALEMAEGARTIVNADYAISTTGIAGPTGGTDEKPVGMVCIGLSGPGISKAKTVVFKLDDREKNKIIFANTALNWLRKHLAEITD